MSGSGDGPALHALLLTDVVDSTLLAEALGDAAMAPLWAAHDRIARDLLRVHGGREIDKTDGMLMLFGAAAAALDFAAAYHAALAAMPQPLRARAGLHVGPVLLRTNSADDVARGAKPLEVEGIAKPVAARVMSVALGGQTLLTAAARDTLGTPTMRLQSHGHWSIKGLAEPVELFEAGADGAPFTPPPDAGKAYRVVRRDDLWLPVREVRHSLPAERDAFVGRTEALADLARRFDAGARLVSLLGIGGTGKTRLATRFAWTWLGDFAGGAWFCDLSQARGVDGLVQAVAQGLDVPLSAGDAVQQLGHAIAARGECLVVLDNFEQITRHAEDTLGRWLDRAAQARFLVTTREVLGLPGEEALALPPLAPPDAAALFLKRGQSARRDFQPDADESSAVAQLVRLLDGLPLAVELAAARVRVMSPRAMLARMDQRFQLLSSAGGRRDRQATLRATFDWSWDLLSDVERSALAQLSVFDGGFTLPAAESVLDLSFWEGAHWTLDVLQSLVDKSLVRALDGARFDLLASVQEYAAEHLRQPGHFPGSGAAAEAEAVERHGRYFASEAARGGDSDDLDNLARACRRAALRGDAPVALATLDAAWQVLKSRGPFNAGADLAAAVLEMPGLDAGQRLHALLHAGSAAAAIGRVAEAEHRLRAAYEGAAAGDLPGLRARCALALGDFLSNRGERDEPQVRYAQALPLARAVGDLGAECGALNGLGSRCMESGRFADAQAYYGQALGCAQRAGDRLRQGAILGNLGNLLWSQGDPVAAIERYTEALAVARELGDRRREGNTLSNLGAVHESQGDLVQAQRDIEAALAVARDIGDVRLQSFALCNLGLVGLAQRQWAAAHSHFETALELALRVEDRCAEGQFLGYLGLLHARQRQFESARQRLAEGEALLRRIADRPSLGLLLCQRAELEWLAEARPQAEATLREAGAIETELGAGADSELGRGLAQVRRLLDAPAASPTPGS